MGEWILTASILVIVVMVLRLLLKGYVGLRFQYSLWIVVLLRLLIPFSLFDSAISVGNAVKRVNEEWLTDQEVHIEDAKDSEFNQEELNPLSPVRPDYSATVAKIALVVWLGGMAVIGMAFFISNVRFRLQLRRSRVPFDPLYLKKGNVKLPVYISEIIETPCLVGIFRPAIYLTEEMADNQSMLMYVLEHECTHYHHRDHIWSLLRCICLILHWYNPLVWKAAALSRLDSELACDEATVKRLGEERRFDYGRVIIELSECGIGNSYRDLTIVETMAVKESQLKERIICLTLKPKTARWLGCIILAVLLTLTFFAFADDKEGEQATYDYNSDSELTVRGDLISYYADDGTAVREYEVDGETVMDRVQVGLACFDLSQEDAPADQTGERIMITLADGSGNMVFYLDEPDMFCRQDAEMVTYWKATARPETERNLFVKTIGEWMFRIFSDLDMAAQHVTFSAQGDANQISEKFVLHIYKKYYLSRMAGSYHSATDYHVFEWRIEAISEDEKMILGWINYGVKPEDPTPRTASFWNGGGSDGKGQYQGWRIYTTQYRLIKQENGEWDWEIGFFGSGESALDVLSLFDTFKYMNAIRQRFLDFCL